MCYMPYLLPYFNNYHSLSRFFFPSYTMCFSLPPTRTMFHSRRWPSLVLGIIP